MPCHCLFNRHNFFVLHPLRPTILEKERERNYIPNLLGKDELIELINNSRSLVPTHTVLGPTHYAYFVDTYELLKSHATNFFDCLNRNITMIMNDYALEPSKDLSALVTAEGSNAELFMPDLIINAYPNVEWVKIDRIRLSKEGGWKFDRLDDSLDSISSIENSVVLIWDDGSNTGNTLTQLIEIVSEFSPKIIFAYCLINRQSPDKAIFLNKLSRIANNTQLNSTRESKLYVQFFGSLPISTYSPSSCPICNHLQAPSPPIREIENYWADFKIRTTPHGWNHISAGEIREKSYAVIKRLILTDVNKFLKLTFKIRCFLGNFENSIGTTGEERAELIGFLSDYQNIVSLFYIFTLEPQLLDSVINFQLRGFKEYLFNSIGYILNNDSTIVNFGEKIIVEFIAGTNPGFIIDNLKLFSKRILKTKECYDILLSRIINQNELNVSYELINSLLQKLESIQKQRELAAYARGLCNASLSWLRIKQSEFIDDDLRNSIDNLKSFYSVIGKPHEQASQFSTPLDRILTIVERFRKLKHIPGDKYFNSIYRDWRDYTVKIIEDRLAPAIEASHSILFQELPSYFQRYFLSDKSDLHRDYLSLQKNLLELDESYNKKNILEEKSDQILRATTRIYDRVFSPTKSPIAKIVGKIPVFIIKHIQQRLENHSWIYENKIHVELENGFMSSYIFKQVLDEVFKNIRIHNFSIDENFFVNRDNKLVIKISIKTSNIVIIIMSNGIHKYKDSPSHGIRSLENKCRSFNGSFNIYNDGEWVKNEITLGRY